MTRRCLSCGRRWVGASPSCGHPQEEIAHTVENRGSSAEAAPAFELPGYRIGGVLGRGGFGTVLAAVRLRDKAQAAIKVFHRLSEESAIRVRAEAAALEAVGPPSVPGLYDAGVLDDGTPYLVLERVSMPPLAIKMAEWSGPAPGESFVTMADAILEALAGIHQAGIIHRDLKPENIVVSEAPLKACILDLGTAKGAAVSAALDGTNTVTGIALGTPDYMAPEQCMGLPEFDHRIDIYAAGVVLYEMLTGRPPFFGGAAEVREAHVARRPQPPSRVAGVTTSFDELILRCLAKAPSQRWRDVAELRKALRHAARNPQFRPRPPAGEGGAAGAGAARSTDSERVAVGLLFFETALDTGAIKRAIEELGGQLMQVRGSRCVAIFRSESSGNPVQRAYDSARALLEQQIAVRALVERDRVRVRKRADGSERLFSTAASRQDRFPQPSDPASVLLTAAAAEAISDIETEFVRDGIYTAAPASGDERSHDSGVGEAVGGLLIGRKEPFQQLIASAERATRNRVPTIVTVLGEVGYGKSFLASAVAGELRSSTRPPLLIHLRAREPFGSGSYESLRALLRAALHGAGALEEGDDAVPEDHGRSLLLRHLGEELGAEVWPAAALALGWLPGDAAEVRRIGAAPAALRSAATRAVGEALRQLAAREPTCCILDDAHFADDATLDALEYATLGELALPLWVCAVARPSFERARPGWGKRAAATRSVRLAPLDRDSARALCRMLLQPAENISEATLARIVQKTQGSPLLLVELARGFHRHGLIRQHGRGDAYYLATDEIDRLPDLPRVEWLAERELAALPPELAAHARLLAHLGAEFSIDELSGVMAELETDGLGEIFPLDPVMGVERLREHGLMMRHRDGRVGFRHQLIREHVVQTTPAGLGMQIHAACLRFYERVATLPDARRLPRLAHHAAESGLSERAAELYLQLAELAAHRHAYLDAESMYSRALAQRSAEAGREPRMAAFTGRGAMRYRLSRFEDALADFGRARAIASERGDQAAEASLVLDMATVYDWTQDFRKAKSLVDEAERLAPSERTPLLDARLHMGQGRAHLRFRHWDESSRLLERAIELSEPLGDAGYENLVISLLMLGFVAVTRRNLDHAAEIFARVIALCEERGDVFHLAVALNNRRELWLCKLDAEWTKKDLLRCRQIGRELGHSEVEYASEYNLAELHYFTGDLEGAWPHLRRAVEIEPANSTKPLSLLLQARLLAYADRRMAARNVLEGIRDSQNRARTMGDMDALFLESEEVLFQMAELATRETMSPEWDALRMRAEEISQIEELVEVVEMMALVAQRRGRFAQGKKLLREALALCAQAPHLIELRLRRQLEG
ncbi:serine/threonine-protein kinase PknK [Haliangium ochraceum]|uniref:Serine/threonine protein kinase n=1 Tax=Haliangium ochraceum (strain DSM 14365 / JCM 11303 / SMP-2) TaxID=502025 RepID=D0LW57_HALO1|nr:protein kinase [Haliangium ochraceum]ACY15989.1 serine/threonine protein kinase [Haliangium ochraceum DSM 14365]